MGVEVEIVSWQRGHIESAVAGGLKYPLMFSVHYPDNSGALFRITQEQGRVKATVLATMGDFDLWVPAYKGDIREEDNDERIYEFQVNDPIALITLPTNSPLM